MKLDHPHEHANERLLALVAAYLRAMLRWRRRRAACPQQLLLDGLE
jgi:hypothetical protein